jgi:protein TonB
VPGGVLGGTALDATAGAAESAGPLRVGGGIAPPRKIKDVKPVFPPGVFADRIRGTVIIEATIGTDGKVRDAKILHSVPALDHAALDAVRQWEYAPSLIDGLPVAIVFTVIVNFVIQ